MAACLVLSLWLVEKHVRDWPEILFLSILGLWFVSEIYWTFGPSLERFWLLRKKPPEGKTAGRTGRIKDPSPFNLYTPQNRFYQKRAVIRHFLQAMLVVASWVMGYHLVSTLEQSHSLLAMGFFLFSMIFLAWIGFDMMRRRGLGANLKIWIIVSLGSGLALGWIFYLLERDIWLGLAMLVFGSALTLVVYVTERTNVGEQVWAEVVRGLILSLLNDQKTVMDWRQIVTEIGMRLGYERVFVLLPDDDKEQLRIEAEYGDYPSVTGRCSPKEQGITGEAFRTKQICASNDVNQSAIYERLVPADIDDTQAEIAVPLHYRGEILGVLDVQSKHRMVYGPGDIDSMEVLGKILSSALAIQRTDKLVEEGTQLWENISKSTYSETEIFKAVAQFTQDELQADLVVFYRLTPTGVMDGEPEILGDLRTKDSILGALDDLASPLYELIRTWEPYFEENVQPGSRFRPSTREDVPGFAGREGIQSAFFIPIGTPDERLAAVFLNYRHHRAFSNLFRLMVIGFAQAFAAVMARERYRDLLFQSVGRPDLGVHNILARYGLKDGVEQEMREILASSTKKVEKVTRDRIFYLMQEVDNCLIELRAQSAQMDSSVDHSLHESVEKMTRKMKDHVPNNRTVRFSKNIDHLVERESGWTRLAIFRVIEESVNNAIYHGNASEIQIQVRRDERSIFVQISNNGESLPDNADRRKSRRGIYSVKEELENRFQARFSIEARQDSSGTIVKAEIPTLPYMEKVSRSL